MKNSTTGREKKSAFRVPHNRTTPRPILSQNETSARPAGENRWKPGQPLPARAAGVEPNALEALRRHAEAHEMEEQRRRFNGRRQPRPADRKEAA